MRTGSKPLVQNFDESLHKLGLMNVKFFRRTSIKSSMNMIHIIRVIQSKGFFMS